MLNTTPRIIRLGGTIITIINAGDMLVNMAEEMAVAESERRHLSGLNLEGTQPFPSQCVHITLSDASILVDINDYAFAISLDPSYLPPDYSPPPDVVEQLLSQGIHPEDITHLVITHAHFDHYSGTTTERDGSYILRFPNARTFLGRADWVHAGTQEALRDPDSLESHTLGLLKKRGMLELVDGNIELTPEVRILAAPGESPGHQIVRVHSQGQTLYCLGDLFHHPVEVEQPAWMVKWADAYTNLTSRQRLIQAALQENALLVASHMPVGRVEGTMANPSWVEL
jgi:glyoxylase-like metal-dependent hydrolase (beta-lactamase superfamily II)